VKKFFSVEDLSGRYLGSNLPLSFFDFSSYFTVIEMFRSSSPKDLANLLGGLGDRYSDISSRMYTISLG